MLQSFLFRIKDHRRKQGRRYQLGYVLLFSIFAILSGADSYRKTAAYIKANYEALDEVFGLNWKRTPAHTTIRAIIKDTSSVEIEDQFRQYSDFLNDSDAENDLLASTVNFDPASVPGGIGNDTDGDGDIDIVAPGKSGLFLFENLLK